MEKKGLISINKIFRMTWNLQTKEAVVVCVMNIVVASYLIMSGYLLSVSKESK